MVAIIVTKFWEVVENPATAVFGVVPLTCLPMLLSLTWTILSIQEETFNKRQKRLSRRVFIFLWKTIFSVRLRNSDLGIIVLYIISQCVSLSNRSHVQLLNFRKFITHPFFLFHSQDMTFSKVIVTHSAIKGVSIVMYKILMEPTQLI